MISRWPSGLRGSGLLRLAGRGVVWVEVPVPRRPGYAEEVGDLRDGLVAGVVELLGERGLAGGELGPAPADASAGAGRGEAVVGVGHDQLALELGEHAEHAEHQIGRAHV